MIVYHPKHIRTTPVLVARDLGCRTRFFPNPERPRVPDWQTDFFMCGVPNATNAPVGYDYARTFWHVNKASQRRMLAEGGVPIPTGDYGLGFVVRPFRHSGGANYRVTQDITDFDHHAEYIAPIYPKRREYRVIFVFGQPLIYLRKKPNEGVDQSAPWGHVNSAFQTINDVANCRLTGTDCVGRLAQFPVVQASHIVAADILYNHTLPQPYVVLELNACPALTIDANREKVVQAVRDRHAVS